jgi:hypothetical protein
LTQHKQDRVMATIRISGIVILSFAVGYLARVSLDLRMASNVVDESWLRQARHCWSGLSDTSDEKIRKNLSHPSVFRATFREYGDQTDSTIHQVSEHKTIEDDATTPYFANDGSVSSAPIFSEKQHRSGAKVEAIRKIDNKIFWIPIDQATNDNWITITTGSCIVQNDSPLGFVK